MGPCRLTSLPSAGIAMTKLTTPRPLIVANPFSFTPGSAAKGSHGIDRLLAATSVTEVLHKSIETTSRIAQQNLLTETFVHCTCFFQ